MTAPPQPAPIPREVLERERVMSHCDTPPQGCWEWRGAKNPKGYGRVWFRGAMRQAHRVVYGLVVATVPGGLQLDHLCRNRACVNPDHLRVVDVRENVLSGVGVTAQNARKTSCVRGHPLDERNTMWRRLGRGCRECDNRRRRVARRARRALLPASGDAT